jgi:uncharacterized repeat protein (TIGR01451 family)
MKTRFAVVALNVVLCLTAATAAFAQTSYTSAASGSWGNAGSWSPAGVPGSGDNVTIQAAHSISLDAARTINNATINGTLQPSGQSLGVTTSFTLNGTMSGAGGVTVNGTGSWTAGTLINYASLTVPPGKTLTISGASTKTLQESGTLNVGGTVIWTGGTIVLNGYGVGLLNIQAGGVFDAQGDNNFTNTYYAGAIVNNGTFKKSGGAGATVVGSGVPFTNNARIEITSGTMTAAAITLNAGTVIAGTGFTVSSGTTTIAGASTVEAGSSMTLATGGTLSGSNNLTVNGTLNWTGGAMINGASVTIPSTGTLSISGTGTKTLQDGFIVNVAGTANWSGGTIHINGYAISTLNIQAGGVFNAQSDNSITNSYYSGAIVNNGTFRKSGGAGTTAIGSGVPFSNMGRIDVLSGTLTAASLTLNAGTIISGTGFNVASGNTTVSGLSIVETGSSMTLSGGRITGGSSLTVNGTLNWTGGSMDSGSGNVTIAPAGVLNLSGAGSKTLGESFQLINGGTAHWTGGSLVINGYVPSTLTNAAGGLFSVECDASITNNYYNGTFVNHGTFRKSVTGGTTSLASGVPFSNFGRIEILTGTMTAPSVTMQTGGIIAGTGFKVASGTLNIAGNSSLEAGATMTLAGGQISGAATLTIDGTLDWTGGSMTGNTGDVTVSSSGLVNILSGTPTISEAYDLINHGAIRWTGGSLAINGYQQATITNAADGLFSVEGDAGVVNTYYAGQFVNHGVFRKSVTSGTTTWASAVPFSNFGRIEILSGTFLATSVSMQTGSVIAGTGFKIGSGTLNIAGDSTLEAGATMTFANGQISGAGNFTIDGTLQWEGGSMTGNSGSTIVAPSAVVNITGGGTPTVSEGYDLINNGTIHWTGGTIHLNGYVTGTLTNAAGGLFSVECDSSITNSYYSGKFVNDGTFRKTAGAGATTVLSGVPFVNNNLIDIQTGTMSSANLTLNAGSVVDGSGFVVSGGSTTVAGPATLASGASMLFSGGTIGGSSTLTIDGTMNWTGGSFDGSGLAAVSSTGVVNMSGTGTKTIINGFDLNNAGTMNWTGGNLAINLNSVFTNQSGGQFLIQTDADITNTYYNGSFTNAGTMQKSASTGTTAIIAAVPFTNSGTIDVQTGALQVTNPSLAGTTILKFGIGGTAPLTGYGRLAVTNAVTLAGTIDVDVINPFVPQGGDLFSVITFTSRTGTLAESLGFGAGRSFTTNYSGSSLTLTSSGPTITPPLSPNSDTITGGATVTINGTGFQGSAGAFGGTVTFGGVASTTVNLVNSTQLTAVAPAHAAGTVDVVVTNPDAQPTTATSAFTYTSNGDLSLTKTASTDRVATSGSLSYVIAVSNSGPSSATDVTVTDTLPAGMTLGTVTGTGWSCSNNAATPPTITCTMLTLAAGAANPITIGVTAPSAANPALTNTANVTSTSSDPNLTNNSGSATVEVIDPPSSITVISADDSGNGTLRQALDDAINGLCTSPCTIGFNLSPVLPIQPLTALPALNTTVILDGTSQPGYAGTPVIEINGSLCACATGLTFGGSGSFVKGLSITSFSTAGLHLGGTGSHEVHDSFIGVTAAQTGAPNGDGIIIDSTTNVHVENNTIAFNTGDGIDVLAGTGHHFISNSMTSNGESAIDLLSVPEPTANDAGDSDTGPNNLQNAPVINSATLVGGDLRIGFDLDSSSVAVTAAVVIEVFGADGVPLGEACFDGNALTNTFIVPAGTAAEGDSVFATATSYGTACSTGPDTVSDGTSETSAAATIVACTPPTVTVSAGATGICTGGSTTLTANVSGGTGPYAYQWHDGFGPIAAATSPTLSVSDGGDYHVVVTDSVTCPATSATVTITETTPTPATITAGGPTTFCNGGAVVLTASAGASYLWSTSETTQSITVTASGNYTVTVTDANGCGSTSAPMTVTVQTTPAATITASGPTTFCGGGSVTLTAASAGSYLWSNGATSQSIVVTTSGNYSVTASNGSCSATSAPETVTVEAAPSPVITGPSEVCPEETFVLDAGAGFASYQWSNGETTQTITVTQSIATEYSVTVTNGGNCAVTATVFVDVPSMPDATITAPDSVVAGSTGNSASIAAHAGAIYHWSVSNGTITAGQGTNAIAFTAGTAGNVVVSVTASTNCTARATKTIGTTLACATAPPSLIAPADGAGGLTAPVTFSWSSVGATSYEVWLTSSTLLGTTTSTQLTGAVPSGTFGWFVVAHFAAGCEDAVSPTRTFTVASADNCSLHAAPQLVAPAAGATVDSPVTFQWTAVADAIGYRLLIETGGPPLQEMGTTNGALSLTATVPPGATVAYVDALFNACPATRSQPVAFTVPEADPCTRRTAAAPLLPVNGSNVQSSSIRFEWSPANDADGYRVWVSVDDGAPYVVGTTQDASLHTTIARGAVTWWVEALYDGCGSTESARFHFTIPAAQNCGTARPEPLSPKDTTISDADPLFSWSAVEGAIGYEVWLAVSNGTPALAGVTGANVTSLRISIPPGELEWFVRVLVDRCPARDSDSAHFTYETPVACSDDERAIGISPLEGAEVTSPVDFTWSAPRGGMRHELFVRRGNSAPQLVAESAAPHADDIALPNGALRWFVRTYFEDGCSPLDSAEQQLRVVPTPPACSPLSGPVISAPGQISGGVSFRIQWTPIAGATSYQLLISKDASFAAASVVTTSATEYETIYPDAAQTIYFRVRAVDARCHPLPLIGPYGPSSAILILPKNPEESAAPLTDEGTTKQTIVLGPELGGQNFVARPDQPWLSVSPSSGVVPTEGITLIVTAHLSSLPPGTSLGGVIVTLTTPSTGERVAAEATTFKPSTVKVTLVPPVTPSPTSTPPPDALIIPAVAHASGVNASFQSDVRVANTSPNLMKYQLTFRPTGPAGIAEGRQTTFSIEPGITVALDDVLRGWFGTGSDSILGTLEVRPLTQTTTETAGGLTGLPNFATFASSRTFNATGNGTFGQSIPAIPYANFIGSALAGGAAPILSLQQIANSDRYRSNLGIVEGSGQPVSLLVSVFGSDGAKLTSFPVNLNGGEHTQLNGFLATHGVNVDDGRVEVSVTSGTGKVTAYASVLDNRTGDPLLVSPVTLSDATNTKWVLPGVADLTSGFANWQTDMRLFNAGTTDVEATLSFHSQTGGAPKTATLTLPAGAVRQLDQALPTVFASHNDGGAIHITTATPSRLIATARTYAQNSTGSFGQFISAITPAEAAGVDSRPLQLLQIEESNRYRTNVGLAEVTGNPVTVEISVVPPDAKFTIVTEVTLAANEFRQIGSLLRAVGLSDTYNARVAVRVVGGGGWVTAYASVIDQVTQDPTYLAAQ